MFKKTLAILCILSTIAVSLTGCGKTADETRTPDCPFTTATWDATPEDVIELENSEHRTYESVYMGQTYTFSKEYLGRPGTIKYMFDDQDALKCVAWAYSGDINDLQSLQTLYDEIHSMLVEKYGESGYNTDAATSGGDVWYFETGNILVSTMITTDATALQYSYLHPDVSHEPKASK